MSSPDLQLLLLLLLFSRLLPSLLLLSLSFTPSFFDRTLSGSFDWRAKAGEGRREEEKESEREIIREKEEEDQEGRRKKNGTSAESMKSGEVLPSEAPYETDNQREERKRLLRRGSKNISRAFLLLRDAESRAHYGGERAGRRNCPGRISGF